MSVAGAGNEPQFISERFEYWKPVGASANHGEPWPGRPYNTNPHHWQTYFKPTKRESVLHVRVREEWLHHRIGPWRVCYRLAIQGEHCVVSEVRILPAERKVSPGTWHGEWRGVLAEAVPEGGIGAAVLRTVPIGRAARLARLTDAHRLLERDLGIPAAPTRPARVPKRRRRGRPQTLTRPRARRVVQMYQEEVLKGRKYSPALAVRLGLVSWDAPGAEIKRAAAKARTLVSRAIQRLEGREEA